MNRKFVFIVAILQFIVLCPTLTYASRDPFASVSSLNNPLRTYDNKTFKAAYKLSGKVWVSALILKNGVAVRRFKNKYYEGIGNHYLEWRGKDDRGSTVPAGYYWLKIVAQENKSAGPYYDRWIRIRVVNKLLFSERFNTSDGLLANNYGVNDVLKKWDVTSQKLYVRNKHGFTNSPIFRAVTVRSDFNNFILNTKAMKSRLGQDPWDGLQIFFRYKDYKNLYAAGIRNDNALHLKKKVAGKYYELAKVKLASNRLNHWYNIKIVARNRRLQIYADGRKYIDIYDSSFSKGKVGLRTDNITAHFDEYRVAAL